MSEPNFIESTKTEMWGNTTVTRIKLTPAGRKALSVQTTKLPEVNPRPWYVRVLRRLL